MATSMSTDGRDPLDFSGRVAIVTGGGRGIGRGIAEAFLAAGADVMVCGRTEVGRRGAPRGGRRDRDASAGPCSSPPTCATPTRRRRWSTAAVERFGRLDVLVNNAGGSPEADAATASPRFSASIVALNLLAPLYCAQAANAVMQDQDDGGSIVNIGIGQRPAPLAGHGRLRGGQGGAGQPDPVAGRRMGPEGPGQRLSAGLVATEAADDHYGGRRGHGRGGRHGAPRAGSARRRDVAGLCLFLASPLAAYVSGANLVAHGGGERPAFLAAVEAVHRGEGGRGASRQARPEAPAREDGPSGTVGGRNRSSGGQGRSMAHG